MRKTPPEPDRSDVALAWVYCSALAFDCGKPLVAFVALGAGLWWLIPQIVYVIRQDR